ncbi:hypothetical protein QBC36DRAFT_311069 [Triangularia setosa]|uniref:Uncharacterized protein n=1 Tax=Triangularia setosa TaxID=2587417 RepID=A0AAN6W8L5_9PEZI|nr:hypothetical protein QBC36DRAFT_311069 [Podospora setosa]
MLSIASDATSTGQRFGAYAKCCHQILRLTSSLLRTQSFYFLALLMDVTNITVPPVASWSLSRSLWLPFGLPACLFVLLLCGILAIPEFRAQKSEELATSDAPGGRESESLLRGSSDNPLSSESPVPVPISQESEYHNSWCGLASKLSRRTQHWTLFVLFACSLVERIAFFSENFFVQFASERYTMPYKDMTWFLGIEAMGATVALGLLLPASTYYHRRHLPSTWAVDLRLTQASVGVLILG